MGKFIFRFLSILVIIIGIIVAYLSYFGLETDKFNALIKNTGPLVKLTILFCYFQASSNFQAARIAKNYKHNFIMKFEIEDYI